MIKTAHPDISKDSSNYSYEINKAYNILKEYIKNYKFTFSENEIKSQYPQLDIEKFNL